MMAFLFSGCATPNEWERHFINCENAAYTHSRVYCQKQHSRDYTGCLDAEYGCANYFRVIAYANGQSAEIRQAAVKKAKGILIKQDLWEGWQARKMGFCDVVGAIEQNW